MELANLSSLPGVSALIDLAIAEDLGRGDATSEAIFDDLGPKVRALMVAREPLVSFGLDIAEAVFARVGGTVVCRDALRPGTHADAGTALMVVEGPAVAVLKAERPALNFVQRLAGVATYSKRFADAVSGTGVRVVDTRKTTPGYRVLEKAAVRAGGCFNHRADLGSGILIKDNHIAAAGSVAGAVEAAKQSAPHSLRIEVEVVSSEQLEEAIKAGAEVVLLDNMSPEEVRGASDRAHAAGLKVEVSGGIRLENIRAYAEAGPNWISVGALTHSSPSVDIALDFVD
jgi:nicotinate-nucleotide pyrophosphorylase (carboxylating)